MLSIFLLFINGLFSYFLKTLIFCCTCKRDCKIALIDFLYQKLPKKIIKSGYSYDGLCKVSGFAFKIR